jgi:hypothetical protein
VEAAQVAAESSHDAENTQGVGGRAGRTWLPWLYELGLFSLVQYWRSFDHLEAYARARDKQHWPAWLEFNRLMKDSRGDVGIWHETYLIRAGEYENIYSGMPLMGLAKAARLANVSGDAETARGRLGAVADEIQRAPGEKRLNSPA